MVPYVFILYMGIMAQLILLIECRNGKLASGEDQLVMLLQRGRDQVFRGHTASVNCFIVEFSNSKIFLCVLVFAK